MSEPEKINISAYLSSIRPYRWRNLYEQIKASGLTFEMVIVGPNEPDFELPKEIRFYKSDVKPSQCFHAAALMGRGEVLLQLVDDLIYSDGAIKMMYDAVMYSDNIMATCQYYQMDVNYVNEMNIAGHVSTVLPTLPVCGMYRREHFHYLGGLDRRFDGVMSELDFYMRMRLSGVRTQFVNGIVCEDLTFQRKENTSLCGKYWSKDRPNFINLWSTNGELACLRNDIVRSYDSKDLLTVNQYFG